MTYFELIRLQPLWWGMYVNDGGSPQSRRSSHKRCRSNRVFWLALCYTRLHDTYRAGGGSFRVPLLLVIADGCRRMSLLRPKLGFEATFAAQQPCCNSLSSMS